MKHEAIKLLTSIRLITVILYQQQILKELSAINVALRATAKDCSDKTVSDVIHDGIKDPKFYVDCQCGITTTFVGIHLNGTYEIHYVVVYEGEGSKTGKLDYFEVFVSDGDDLDSCSTYDGVSVISEEGMRVNCKPFEKMNDKVIIRSLTDQGFSLSEVEVHTLASGLPGEGLKLYRGCFKKFGISPTPIEFPVLKMCQKKCSSDGHIFFAIKNASMCYCDDDFDDRDEISLEACESTCEDGINNCGGPEVYSVYLGIAKLPTYHACCQALNIVDLPKLQGNMSVGKCLQHCEDSVYAILYDGDVCVCENKTDMAFRQSTTSCTSKCSGNSKESCGGRDFVSMFETCSKALHSPIKCSKFIKCEFYDKNGFCNGDCKPGFTGDHCIEREVPKLKKTIQSTKAITSLATIGTHTSTSQKTSEHTSSVLPTSIRKTRLSVTSYFSEGVWENCENSNPCQNRANTDCIVNKGKVMCECKIGYSQSNLTCEDIDECQYEPCDVRYSTCINIDGTYHCTCKQGYRTNFSEDICVENARKAVDPKLIYDLPPSIMVIFPLASILLLLLIVCFTKPSASSESA